MTELDFSEYKGIVIMHNGVKVAEITQDDITLFDDAVAVIMEEEMKS